MTELLFSLPAEYNYVLLAVILQVTHYVVVGMQFRNTRLKLLNPKFLEENFGDVHRKAFGTPVPKGGYPDDGEGRYVKKLGYNGWLEFNNSLRTHQQYKEWILAAVFITLLSGQFNPITTAILGVINVIGRVVYTAHYKSKGPDGRFIGVALHELPIIAMNVMIGVGAYKALH